MNYGYHAFTYIPVQYCFELSHFLGACRFGIPKQQCHVSKTSENIRDGIDGAGAAEEPGANSSG